MKRNAVLFITCLALAGLLGTAFPAHAELKIGYIRPQYIFENFEPYQTAQKELEKYEQEELKELQKMQDEFRKKVEEAESQAVLMSDEMKEKKRQELQKTDEELQQYWDELYNRQNGKLVKKQNELLQPIIDRINQVLMRIGKAEEYDFILDAEGPILYANEKHDLSDYVLEQLKKDIPAE